MTDNLDKSSFNSEREKGKRYEQRIQFTSRLILPQIKPNEIQEILKFSDNFKNISKEKITFCSPCILLIVSCVDILSKY